MCHKNSIWNILCTNTYTSIKQWLRVIILKPFILLEECLFHECIEGFIADNYHLHKTFFLLILHNSAVSFQLFILEIFCYAFELTDVSQRLTVNRYLKYYQ